MLHIVSKEINTVNSISADEKQVSKSNDSDIKLNVNDNDLYEDANGNVIKTYDGKKWIPINNKEDNTQNSQIEHLLNIINEKANKKDVYTIA